MKKDMPLEGLRWSRDSGSALYDTPQNGRSRTGWGGISTRPSAHLVRTKQSLLNVGTSINKDYFRRVHWMPVFK